ncbi:MAG: hypothetical protein CEO19_394, partial [Parcubacteria group bacterium Gr01-1014_73]
MIAEQKPKRTASVKELADSMVEIESELAAEELAHHRTHILKHLSAETEIAGFRKGFAPEKIILEKFGEMGVLERAVGAALNEVYPELLLAHRIDAIGRPEITITKLSPGQPASFKIKTAVVPKFALPDYKKIAAKINAQKELSPEVSDKEIEELLLRLRYQLAGKNPAEKLLAEEENKLPAITDELVKKLGDYIDITDFKIKTKIALLEDKKRQNREKKRLAIFDGILEKTVIPLPPVLIENETDYLEARFTDDLKMMGSNVEEYLKNAQALVDQAVAAGADAIKFQTHNVEDEQLDVNIISPHFRASDRYHWVARNTRATPLNAFWKPLKEYCNKKGIIFFST